MGGYIALLVVGVLVFIFYVSTFRKRNGLIENVDRIRYGRGSERVSGFIMLSFWVVNTTCIFGLIVGSILKMIGLL